MNKQRRKTLESINNDLENIKSTLEGYVTEPESIEMPKLEEFRNKVADAQSQLETLRDEEQEYFDNMPEGLQAGDKGSVAEEAIGNLEQAVDSADEVVNQLDEAMKASGDELEASVEQATSAIESAIDAIDSSMSS